MPGTMQMPPATDLQDFVNRLPAGAALRTRTLAHAWETGGGTLQVGRVAIRLLARDRQGRAFTAGTLHAAHGQPPAPALEVSRVLLEPHGITASAWSEWCDERPDLRSYGFDPAAKFPAVRLDALPDAPLARLALGLRDLARMLAA